MSLTIELPPGLEQRLQQEAAQKRKSATDYALSALEAERREQNLGAVALRGSGK